MRFVRLATAALLLAAGFAVAVATTRGAAAGSGTPTIQVDTTFNGGNPVSLNFPAPIGVAGSTTFMEADAVARQSDGKVVVGGSNTVNGKSDFDIARLNADGTLDTSFGSGGYADIQPVAGTTNYVSGIAIQPDGKIVVAGTSNFNEIALVRLNADGSPDTTFNSAGAQPGVLVDNSDQGAYAVALDAGGNIDIATASGRVRRYSSSGVADSTFGTNGASASLMSQARGIAIQPDGKIVIAGSTGFSPSSAMVARVNSDGSTDTGFGTNGSVDITPGGSDEGLNSIALQGSDILVGGETNQGDGSVLARLTPSGVLDTSFGTGGRIAETTSGSQASAVFYSPHPLIISIANDSDESQGDTPQDDTDAQVCIRDTSTGEPFHCLPVSDVEAGSFQTGAQSVNSNGSTLDPAGTSSDGLHATVGPQILTFDLPPTTTTTTGVTATTTTSTTTPPTTTTPQKCSILTDKGTQIDRPCADLAISSGLGSYWTDAMNVVLNRASKLPRVQQLSTQKKIASTTTHFTAVVWPALVWEWAQVDNNGDDAGGCTVLMKPYFRVCDSGFSIAPGTSWWFWFSWWASPGVYTPEDSITNENLPDPSLANNVSRYRVAIYNAIPVTRTKATARKFSGTASTSPSATTGKPSGPSPTPPPKRVGGVSKSGSRLDRVEIAVLRFDSDTKVTGGVIESKACNWLTGPRPTFAAADSILGVCLQPHWLPTSGSPDWSYNLSSPLPAGDYVLLVRTVNKAGAASSTFSVAAHTFLEFHVP